MDGTVTDRGELGLLRGTDEAARKDLLPGLAAGTTIGTLALLERPGRWDEASVQTRARRSGSGWTLDGGKRHVLDGHTADLIMVGARTPGGVALFAVDGTAPGLTRTPVPTLDQTRKQAHLEFTGTPARLVGDEADGWRVLRHVLDTAAILLAAGSGARAGAGPGRGLLMVNLLSVRRGVSGNAQARAVWADMLWAGPGGPGQPEFRDGFATAIRKAEASLARRYPGVLIWFGSETWQWWALPSWPGPGGLVSASSPEELAQLLDAMEAARRPPSAAADDISYARTRRQQHPGTATARPRIEPTADVIRASAQACLPAGPVRNPSAAARGRNRL